MPSHLRLVTTASLDPDGSDNVTAFLSALTALSERFGIAIGDGAELYEMEPDDRLFTYHADAESRLSRT